MTKNKTYTTLGIDSEALNVLKEVQLELIIETKNAKVSNSEVIRSLHQDREELKKLKKELAKNK